MSVGLLAALVLAGAAPWALGASGANWVAGTNYEVLGNPQPTSVRPGKIEVTEVFSYACPACNAFYPTVDKLRASLPANAVLDFVSAAFIPSEDWPMFQRAYYTASLLGLVNPRIHDAMFNAVWKTGELAVADPKTDRLIQPAPTIQDAAKFYAQETGVSAAKFVAASNSFGVVTKMHEADQYIQDCQVDQTPTIIVNGKYRLTPQTAGGYQQLIELVKYLVAKESAGG
ncbi:MAG TPA: thiol:disulfide interchange protein DsbA/DsbL [Steroidobacteraceae bacterium]|jgi:thiol:disulfide interchange protein DsbA|nr:thiol:disulfide interchange protein DsbA/DsbL [Steroidobacteraceae bacterium]